MFRSIYYVILFLLFTNTSFTQNTVGLLSYNAFSSYDGFNLIYPNNQPNVYLLNNCGEIVHVWEDDALSRPGNTVYLTEDGLLYKTKRNAIAAGDAIFAGGAGAIIEIRDWDNNLIWQFEMNDEQNRLHHDFTITDAGTIIAIAWEVRTLEEAIEAGIDPSILDRDEVWPDWLFEIDPSTDSIIWEWHAWDHLIQDFDPTKSNFGVVADHRERIDINFYRADGNPDWMHANAIDYNEETKQILLSVPYFDEFWIIDHTTSTEEAAGTFGGFSNLGGDLMYRWGNPAAYQNGDDSNQQIFFQHDVHWIDEHISPAHPDYGKIGLFNNRVGNNFSTANILTPPWDMYNWRYDNEGELYGPLDFDRVIEHPEDPSNLFSPNLSSLQVLPNDNVLITAGTTGYTFEMTPDNEIVWEYVTPFDGSTIVTQGGNPFQNFTFRVDRYPLDFPAFEGRDLSPKGFIELEPNEDFCDELTSVDEFMDDKTISIYPNPTSETFALSWDGIHEARVEIRKLDGQLVDVYSKVQGGRLFVDASRYEQGVYIVSIRTSDSYFSRKLIKR